MAFERRHIEEEYEFEFSWLLRLPSVHHLVCSKEWFYARCFRPECSGDNASLSRTKRAIFFWFSWKATVEFKVVQTQLFGSLRVIVRMWCAFVEFNWMRIYVNWDFIRHLRVSRCVYAHRRQTNKTIWIESEMRLNSTTHHQWTWCPKQNKETKQRCVCNRLGRLFEESFVFIYDTAAQRHLTSIETIPMII